VSGERLPGFGGRSTPKTCPACGTYIKGNVGGTVTVRLFLSLSRLNPDHSETPIEPEENRIQHYHLPCWRAAVKRFNEEQAEAFHT